MRFLAFLLALCVGEVFAEKTNIVFIIADDMAWDDSGVYGNPKVRTPHIDRLAGEGMRFTRAILTCSSCSPSRASIITGRYPHNTGAEELHWPLPGDQTTFVELLKESGYWTAAAGKWHLGDAVRDRFDEIREVDTSGFQLPAGEAGKTGKFAETGKGDEKSGCHEWVPLLKARPKEKPFFLWLAALDPHRPYDEGILEKPHLAEDVRVAPYHLDTPEVRKDYALYYDEITRLDRFVGLVMAELDAQGVADDTLVLFISDNGRPFPRDKTSVYDSGIRTPWIVRWPGHVEAGTVTAALVSAVDIAPSFLEVAGLETPGAFEGRSFLPVLRNPASKGRNFAYAEKNWHDYEDHSRAVRSAKFKYIRNYYHDLPGTPPADAVRSESFQAMLRLSKEGKLTDAQMACIISPRPEEEFYDVEDDPHEVRNLAGDPEYAEEIEAHRKALLKWESTTGDRVPGLRTADEFDRERGTPTAARVRPRLSKKEMVAKGLAAP